MKWLKYFFKRENLNQLIKGVATHFFCVRFPRQFHQVIGQRVDELTMSGHPTDRFFLLSCEG